MGIKRNRQREPLEPFCDDEEPKGESGSLVIDSRDALLKPELSKRMSRTGGRCKTDKPA